MPYGVKLWEEEAKRVVAALDAHNTEELAWLAGILDGEACFFIDKMFMQSHAWRGIGYRCVIRTAMTHRETIARIAEMTGQKVHEVKPARPGYKPQFVVTIQHSKRIIPVLKRIMPYLVTRREDAMLLLEASFAEEQKDASAIQQFRDKIMAQHSPRGVKPNAPRTAASDSPHRLSTTTT